MNLILRKWHIWCLFIAFVSFLQSCKKDTESSSVEAAAYDSSTPFAWNELYLELDKVAGGYRPGASARTAGLVNYAVYEAVVPGMPAYKSLAPLYANTGLSIPSPSNKSEYNWPIVANCTYKYMLERLFYQVAQSDLNTYAKIQDLYNSEFVRLSTGIDADVVQRSKTFGEDVGRAVYQWSKTDAFGHDVPRVDENYIPPVFAGSWEPTFPDFTKAFFPHWGNVRTFAPASKTISFLPPIPYSTDPNSAYYKEGYEVYKTVKDIKAKLPGTHEQEWVAWFWSDDITGLTFSPPARLIAVADQIVQNEQMNLEEAVVFYAKLGTAINDISVAVWKGKYTFNIERPISYIRKVLKNDYPDASDWTTILNDIPNGVNGVTPPFPAYPSGHSGFAGGGEVVFAAIMGSDSYVMTDNCHKNRTEFLGTPRTYNSFRQMAEENAFSRVPLGVHFRMDCVEGLRVGREVSNHVLALPWQ